MKKCFTYNNFEKRRKNGFSYVRSLANRIFGRRASSEVNSLEACVAAAKQAKGYTQTEDAMGELAKDCRGENLVVFAERV